MNKKGRERKKAIALQYEPEQSPAPKVVASGAGELAKKIMAIADKQKIPIVEDDWLAQLLYPLQPGELIPESLYRPVAKLLAYIALYKQEKNQSLGFKKPKS